MYSSFKLNIIVTSILVCLFASTTKAQLASSKSLTEIYNEKINEKLAEENTTNHSPGKKQNLLSERSSLREDANLKMKNSKIVVHDNSTQSNEEKKHKLPSNSTKLKQMGSRAKPPTLPLH